MTVKELIAELIKLPQNLAVIDSSYILIDGVKVVEYTYGDVSNPKHHTYKAVQIGYLYKWEDEKYFNWREC